MEPVCAWKSLEMDFSLFLWFVVFFDVDPCPRNLMFVTVFKSFVGYF